MASAKALQRTCDLAVSVRDIRAAGAVTLVAIANELNGREMMTPRGGRWYPSSVATYCGGLGDLDRSVARR